MKTAYQQQHAKQLTKILDAFPKARNKNLKPFTQQFYAKMPSAELARLEAAQAAAVAASAYEFTRERPGSRPKIRIFTPQKKEQGYAGHYTVVELLNDDMPFLVDSLTAELSRHGFTIREIIHPILSVKRDKKGILQGLGGEGEEKSFRSESLIHFEISSLPEGLTAAQLESDLEGVLAHIRATVENWRDIAGKVTENSARLDKIKGVFDKDTIVEAKELLRWLVDRNFVFMGYGEYDFYDSKGREKLSIIPASRLGILKISEEIGLQGLETLPPELRPRLLGPQLIDIAKSNRRSPVHRPVPMDTISIKRLDAAGHIIGEARFLGLFTSNVYYQSADAIPLVRRKILDTLKRSDFAPASHDGKALKAILEFLPRDEIFQMSADELFDTSMGILALETKPGVRVFARRDALERFVSCMIFVPRERFSTELRHQIQEVIEKAFNGSTSSFSTQITEDPLARLHLIIKTTPGEIPATDIESIEQAIARRAYLWGDFLLEALLARHGEHKAEKLQREYSDAFPQSYINRYDSGAAVYDIGKIEEALERGSLALELFRNKTEEEGILHLKIYNPNEEIALSDILPMLENAGFRAIEEHPFPILPHGARPVWIRDFKLQMTGETLPLEQIKPLLEEALLKVWRREMENDRFNALIARAGLRWKPITMLRAYARYLRQTGFTYAPATIEQTMSQQPGIVRNLVALFEARFMPGVQDREATQKEATAAMEKQLAEVGNAAEDRILRRYADLIMATARTNYYRDSAPGSEAVLSLKLLSHKVPDLPQPVPFAEIFVYSPRVEGIHLRGGKVARGGLRWSDRHEDFRTEVLGLMKAQMVKNSVIVPVGSKGGFVVKQPSAVGGRDAVMEEGIACYTLYLQALLDVTDNIVKGKIVPPQDVVRHDEDDPYLVVAADKGTASFSDIANSVSAAYHFWLGDAFASGGSAGYDHKEMAITARGAWISVTRHFHEIGMDIERQDFTVAGIGDMAGDVFGNGMLLSRRIKLVAAFNHMHIFLDPNPDPESGFKERERLFRLPRSSWRDYDASLLSRGGGIFERSAKTIPISKEVQETLGVRRDKMTPDEFIKAILLAPVDLLWNGGIGTYVKAEEESHEAVGDRANNGLRVSGRELRCKVVGEGGNLGFTQRGRIEYARLGGRINTDAIDNSAGVDCSDHEVNIKIALSQEIMKGSLTLPRRDKLLTSMTEDVARLVLKDNLLQTQAITVAQQQGFRLLESQGRLMHRLEKNRLLDRALEFLPTDKQLTELKAARKGLTRPELAVLLAYSKMVIYRELLESTLPDEEYFLAELKRYFPKAMQEKFAGVIAHHPLKREIIATAVTNSIVNRAGITFFFDIAEDLGVGPRDIASAYTLARDAFGLRALWKDIESAQNVSVATQVEMYAAVGEFLERVTMWLLRNLALPLPMDHAAKELIPGIADIIKHQETLRSDTIRRASEKLYNRLTDQSVEPALAEKISSLEFLSSAFDIILLSKKTRLPVPAAGKVYFQLGSRLRLGWLRLCASRIAPASHWERLALQSLVGDLYDEQQRLTGSAIARLCKKGECAISLEEWEKTIGPDLARFDRFMDDLKSGDTPDIPRLMVALRHIRSL